MSTDQKTQLERTVETFYLDREVMGCTQLTLLWYRRYLGALLTWLTARGVTTAQGITLELLRAYVLEKQTQYAPKTVHHHASVAKVFCKWLASEGLVTVNPAERLPRPKLPQKVLPALTKEDARKLLDACDELRDKALLLFMLDTGARCSETVAVNIGDVDAKTGAVTIAKGKNQRGRTVYLGAQARRAVQRYLLTRDDLGADTPLWVSLTHGTRLTPWGITGLLKHLSGATGVKVHPHMLRRTFAVWSLRAGMDVARLAALLGHSNLATVQKYLSLLQSDLADAHAQHGAVDSQLSKKGR